jgi:hypothetical protein
VAPKRNAASPHQDARVGCLSRRLSNRHVATAKGPPQSMRPVGTRRVRMFEERGAGDGVGVAPSPTAHGPAAGGDRGDEAAGGGSWVRRIVVALARRQQRVDMRVEQLADIGQVAAPQSVRQSPPAKRRKAGRAPLDKGDPPTSRIGAGGSHDAEGPTRSALPVSGRSRKRQPEPRGERGDLKRHGGHGLALQQASMARLYSVAAFSSRSMAAR